MPIPNFPAGAKVSFVGNRDTREWVNVFHVHKTNGPIAPADLVTLAGIYRAFWDNYRAAVPTICALDVIELRGLDPLHPYALDYTNNLPSSGLRSGVATAPANVTLALSWRTGLAGRKHRGRNYIPGVVENDLTSDDRINSPFATLLSSIAAQYLAAIPGGGPYEPIIYHILNDTFDAVTSFVIDSILDSQRRRLPGRGR